MRINIKRLRHTADKMGVIITQDTDAHTGGKIYTLAGGILDGITEQYTSAEAVRDRLDELHRLFIDDLNADAGLYEEGAELLGLTISAGLYEEGAEIEHPAEEPEYLSVTDYKERAELLGLTISTEPDGNGGTVYTASGGYIDSVLDEEPHTFNSLAELTADVNSLWDDATTPEMECWTDDNGRLQTQTVYPTSPLY